MTLLSSDRIIHTNIQLSINCIFSAWVVVQSFVGSLLNSSQEACSKLLDIMHDFGHLPYIPVATSKGYILLFLFQDYHRRAFESLCRAEPQRHCRCSSAAAQQRHAVWVPTAGNTRREASDAGILSVWVGVWGVQGASVLPQ